MFAGFNVMRPKVIREHGFEDFEFSTAYLQFWDKLEKSNQYLESVIELREADRLDRDWLLVNEWMVGDGGWWNYVTGLIEKYGVVPASVMPETHSSENTGTMNLVLGRMLRVQASEMLKKAKEGVGVEGLRKLKEEGLKEVYRFLVINLGEPPVEFEWRHKAKAENRDEEEKKEEAGSKVERLTEWKRYTPQGFYEDFVGVDLKEFVCLYHDPSQELNEHYRFARTENVVGQGDMHFVNVSIEEMKGAAVKSVLANESMWFAVNMGYDQSTKHGLMQVDLFDYEGLFGVEATLSKAERSRFGAGASNHAMVLMGVDLREGKPKKWLVENSWGSDKGKKGMWTLCDEWFTEHVYTVIVHRKHVSEATLKVFEKEAKVLPAWYPGGGGLRPS